MPRFTIITPTLGRESLRRTCESVDSQTFGDWEHIVWFDGDMPNVKLMKAIASEKRFTYLSFIRANNFGNTPRHDAWVYAKGDYLLYVDDDNFVAHNDVLLDINKCLLNPLGEPPFAIFPILRHGQWFFTGQPRLCHVDTANLVVKREIGRWPDIPDYTADGILAEHLVQNYPDYRTFPLCRPIIVMETSNCGR